MIKIDLTISELKDYGLSDPQAKHFQQQLKSYSKLDDNDCWQKISTNLLTPEIPFALHQKLYSTVYANREDNNPGASWFPSKEEIQNSNLYQLMQNTGHNDYPTYFNWAKNNYADFWRQVIDKLKIQFTNPYDKIVNLDKGIESPSWLVNSKLNIVNSCLPDNKPKHPAITYQDHKGKIGHISYNELENITNRVANSLIDKGFSVGDAIAINMPMTVESVAIYLGIIKAGCVVVSIADSFAPPEITNRLDIIKTKAIFTQDLLLRANKSLPLYDKVVQAKAPMAIVLPAENNTVSVTLREGDLSWDEFLGDKTDFVAKPRNPHAHINILFSSGTTGTPKAIPWDQTSAIKAASDGFLYQNVKPADIFCWPTNLGWMMGPWLIFATLINQGTIALYYDAPTTPEFTKFITDTKVNILGVVPSLVKCWRHNHSLETTHWPDIKLFSSSGEASNSNDMLFLMSRAKYNPLIEYCGGTEISGGYVTSTVLQENIPAAFSTPTLGLDLALINEEGNLSNPGEVAILPPSIGLSRELLNFNHHDVYYDMPSPQGVTYRRHGDQLEKIKNGYYRALGRVDDTMNIGGIKISAAEIERCLLNIDDKVVETAAISVEPKDKGPSSIVIYLVIKNNTDVDLKEIKVKMQKAISQQLNPLFKISEVILIDSLPRTSSNKIMRRVLRDKY